MSFDFIIIGSGLAGLTSALTLAEFGKVLLITKSALADSATDLAQGGIAAVVTGEDSFESHIKDTLVAGAYHNSQKAVECMVRNAPEAIAWLVKQGVRLDFAPTREAAHSFNRILHASDFTGREIERALSNKVQGKSNITIFTNCFTLDLLVAKKKCLGVQVIYKDKILNIFGRATILATGGLGQIYKFTTNPKVATGDGLAMAQRAGCSFSDLEFIQFHPTALKDGQSPLFLLSEALRGEGARLVNKKGEQFMRRYDSRGEMAPRDIVARAIFAEEKKGNRIFLDIRGKGEKFIRKRFPNIDKELKLRGFNLAKEAVPVTPAAHYSCGGIKVDLYGRTSIKNLFAFGEVAATGVHGANRLASNSLLEAIVFPLRLSLDKLGIAQCKRVTLVYPELVEGLVPPAFAIGITGKLQKLMWEKVGIVRTRKGMLEALAQIKIWENEMRSVKGINKDFVQLKNMLSVARLVTTAALKRKNSLGAHFVVE